MTDKLLNAQQNIELKPGETWDSYFPYKLPYKGKSNSKKFDDSFISILRFSLYRPRDIITMLQELQSEYKQNNLVDYVFKEDDFLKPTFRGNYSTYLLGEIRDHLLFYYTRTDFEYFIKFFQYLHGKTRFNYKEFVAAYDSMQEYLESNKISAPLFLHTADTFLQFLYEMNVLNYIEDSITSTQSFISWCFKERTLSNIAPKVRTHVRYEIHYGLIDALRMGKVVK